MKKTVLLASLAALGTFANVGFAQEMARVISSVAVITQVGVPRQVCTTQQVQVQQPKSGGGALLGAIAGGAIGNALGGGDGKAVATVLGIFGGAMMGDRVEGQNAPQTQNVQNCTTQTFYESRTTGYNVVYEYAGKQYQVQMPNDPGQFVKLQITPVGAAAAQNPPQQALPQQNSYVQPDNQPQVQTSVITQQVYTQPVYTQPVYTQPLVVAAAPAVIYAPAPVYYARPYYPPIGVNLNLGWVGGGYARHGHGHWR